MIQFAEDFWTQLGAVPHDADRPRPLGPASARATAGSTALHAGPTARASRRPAAPPAVRTPPHIRPPRRLLGGRPGARAPAARSTPLPVRSGRGRWTPFGRVRFERGAADGAIARRTTAPDSMVAPPAEGDDWAGLRGQPRAPGAAGRATRLGEAAAHHHGAPARAVRQNRPLRRPNGARRWRGGCGRRRLVATSRRSDPAGRRLRLAARLRSACSRGGAPASRPVDRLGLAVARRSRRVLSGCEGDRPTARAPGSSGRAPGACCTAPAPARRRPAARPAAAAGRPGPRRGGSGRPAGRRAGCASGARR